MKKIHHILFAIFCFLFMHQSYSQSQGQLDPSFAVNGELADSAIFPFQYSGLAISTTGEFVVSFIKGSDTLSVIRFTENGVRDVSFGNNGLSIQRLPGFSGAVSTSAVQSDQKILVAGKCVVNGTVSKGFIIRLNGSGTIDSSFGTSGILLFNLFSSGEGISQIALQSNGQILVLDVADTTSFSGALTDTVDLLRINANGTFDSSFATNGVYHIPFYAFLPTGPFYFNTDLNNHINFAAYSNYSGGNSLYMFQLNISDGSLSTGFGQNGSVLITSTNLINSGNNLGLNFQSDDKLVTVQSAYVGPTLYAVCRYNTDGSMDNSFGTNGLSNAGNPGGAVPFNINYIAPAANNQIITAGIVNQSESLNMVVSRFNGDGSVDSTFGNYTGHAILNCLELDDIVYNLVIQPDNKILINGLVNENNYNLKEVVRLLNTSVTGISDISEDENISIYPNPLSVGSWQLLVGNNLVGAQIAILDDNGRVVYKSEIKNTHSEIPAPASGGIYLLRITSGRAAIVQKMVKL